MSDSKFEYDAVVRWTHPDGFTESENIFVMAYGRAHARMLVADELRCNYEPGGKIITLDRTWPGFTSLVAVDE